MISLKEEKVHKGKGFRKVEEESIYQYRLPRPGQFILYNEVKDYRTHSGRDVRPYRGFCQVEKYINYLAIIKVYNPSGYESMSSLLVRDIRIGLVRYVTLDKGVLEHIGECKYHDLDIFNLPEDIQKYVIDNNEVRKVREHN